MCRKGDTSRRSSAAWNNHPPGRFGNSGPAGPVPPRSGVECFRTFTGVSSSTGSGSDGVGAGGALACRACFNDKLMRFLSTSTPRTITSTSCPGLTTFSTLNTRLGASSET